MPSTNIRVFIIKETEKALFVSKLPEDRDWAGIWIPRSLCEHITKMAPRSNGWRESQIKMQEWIAEQKGLL